MRTGKRLHRSRLSKWGSIGSIIEPVPQLFLRINKAPNEFLSGNKKNLKDKISTYLMGAAKDWCFPEIIVKKRSYTRVISLGCRFENLDLDLA